MWFEEELIPSTENTNDAVKEVHNELLDDFREAAKQTRGILRAYKPEWDRINSNMIPLHSGKMSQFFKVRLQFDFEISKDSFDKKSRFVYARCTACLWSATANQPQPWVYDMFPRDLYEGEPQKVRLEFNPEIKAGSVEGSLGGISTDIAVGQITPVTVGFMGKEKREPHWDLRPKMKALLGVQFLWLVLAVPQGCDGARLAVFAEGDIQTRLGTISVGPKSRVWDNRPSIIIGGP